jgi:hypothetical protein
VYLIVQAGWVDAARPRPIVDTREQKSKEDPDFAVGKQKFKSDLIPAALLIARHFAAEQAAIEALEGELDAIDQQIDERREEHGGEGGLLEEVVDEKGRISKPSVAARLKDIGRDPDYAEERKALEDYSALLDQQADAKARLKAAQESLEAKVATKRTISQAGIDSCSAQLLPPGSLLLCSRATIGELKIASRQVCTNQGFKSLIAGDDVNNEFLYYLLLTMRARIVERAIGSTFLEISKKEMASLKVLLPLFDEQTAIAAVLSDMDAELAALEARLAKTRALKQGMMQELLTGRTGWFDASEGVPAIAQIRQAASRVVQPPFASSAMICSFSCESMSLMRWMVVRMGALPLSCST